MKVNLGSYKYPLPGYVNVDICRWDGVDVVADLNKLPWPFATGSVDEVRAVDILEHLGKLSKVESVGELARIVKPGGIATVRVPCSSHPWAWASLQHAHAFQYNSFERSYAQPWFDVVSAHVQFTDGGIEFPLNRLTRTLCKYTHLIHTLKFVLGRV